MTTRLEEDLTAGLREHAAGVHLTRDVLDAARRRHRRRTAVTRAASATGTVGLAGAVAAAVVVHGSGSPAGSPGAPPAASSPVDVRLDAATVSARIAAALADVERSVLHIRMRVTLGGASSRNELWTDPTTGDLKVTGPKVPGNPRVDYAIDRRGRTEVATTVDHDTRTWWRETRPVLTLPDDGDDRDRDAGPLGDFSPEGLRDALRKGAWTLVGEERLDGRGTVHLRVTDAATFGAYDLWVDAESYAIVRRVVVKADEQAFRLVEDYAYLPRSEAVLSQLGLTAPAGYEHVDAPQPDLGPPPKGGRG